MKYFLFILLTLTTFANSQSILVNQIFMTHDIYNDGVTYNIATFSYDQTQQTTPISDAKPSDELSIKLGIISSSNTLVDLLWEYQSIHSSTPHNLVQSVELNDLNNDQSLDIIINYSDPDSEFPDQTISSFLINNKNKFQELSETFIRSRYELLDNSHIKYESPLALFGRPYVDEDAKSESNYWIDYYEFQGLRLVNINQKYKSSIKTLNKNLQKNSQQHCQK